MNGLHITLIILLVLFLVGCIRIGARVEYCHRGLFVHIRAGVFLIPVFPLKEKKQADRRVKPAGEAAKPKKGGLLKLALKFLPLILETIRKFRRRLQVDKLELDLVVCGPDPGDAAMAYGRANAVLASLWQPIIKTFHVKDGNAHVGVDFDADKSTIYILASLSLTIGQALALALVFGVKGLGILIKNRSGRGMRTEQREAV